MSRFLMAAQSVVLYEGPSEYDGAPLVALATCLVDPSRNGKTGPMGQMAFIRADVGMNAAVMGSTCGDCALTPFCYVDMSKLHAAHKKYMNGGYELDRQAALDAIMVSRYSLRIGWFGNASSVPFEVTGDVVEALVEAGKGWCLYEHGWRDCDPRFQMVAMASVETLPGAVEAHDAGWRFFLALPPSEVEEAIRALNAAGIPTALCPHEATSGRVQCADCGWCNGQAGPCKMNVVNPVHGALNKVKAHTKWYGQLPAASRRLKVLR